MSTKKILEHQDVVSIIDNVFGDYKRPSIPSEIHDSILDRQKKILYDSLIGKDVYEKILPRLIQELKNKYHQALIYPGESIGILCAQSIGERQTQMTLNTFHAAGMTVQTVITGVPRFLELLNASKDPKLSSSKCYINNDVYKDIHHLKQILSKEIIDIRLNDICTSYEVLENNNQNEKFWYSTFKQFYKTKRSQIKHQTKYFVRYYISREALYRYNIYMFEIVQKIYQQYQDVYCIFSPNYIAILDIYMDLKDVQIPTDTEYVEDVDDDESVVMSKNKMDMEKLKFLTNENKDLVYIEEVFIPQLNASKLFGIPNIKDYLIEKNNHDDTFVVHTQGNNFQMLLTCPYINTQKTVSNNMWNIYEVLGIEATREFLISEFTNIVSSDGTFINGCHIELLVDIMTFSGSIISISRYGMKNDQFGALAKASFEESLDNFLKAGFFSETETTQDVSASIICGKRPNIGTGLCDVLLDIYNLL